MAKAKPRSCGKEISSYTIKGTNQIIKAGDCVLIRPWEKNCCPPYVGRVMKMEADKCKSVRVTLRWYYRPEEAIGGRRAFHGVKEVLWSDHEDIQSANTIEGKCTVHTFDNYIDLEEVGLEDYYCRYEFLTASQTLLPEVIAVYCVCEQPYNPDKLMIQCAECEDWFHPQCLNMTEEQVNRLKSLNCSDHESDEESA